MFRWLRKRRRRALLAEPLREQWLAILQANIGHYALLSANEQAGLRDRLRIVVAEKNWEGCGGLVVSDEMRVTVAAQASLLLLGVPLDYCFDGVKSILLYPNEYAHPLAWQVDETGASIDIAYQGEAWHRGPVVLSWPHVLEGARDPADGSNLVLHEFAHHLDGLDGEPDGVPPLASRAQYRRWYQVTEEEYLRLKRASRYDRATLLDTYGASSRAEFFAVSTECFFERPLAMQERHPQLYDILRQFYHQDPAVWFRSAAVTQKERSDAR